MVDITSNRHLQRRPRKCFLCGSEYHMIAKFPKTPKDNEKQENKVLFIEKRNRVCENSESSSDQKI